MYLGSLVEYLENLGGGLGQEEGQHLTLTRQDIVVHLTEYNKNV